MQKARRFGQSEVPVAAFTWSTQVEETVVEEEEATVELDELHLPQVAGHWTVIRS